MRQIALTAALITTMTACTAVQPGSADYAPLVQPSAESVTRVAPGQTVYVQYTYSRAMLEENDEFDTYFDALVFDYSAASAANPTVADVTRLAPWLKLKSFEAPKGVTITPTKASIMRKVNKTTVSNGSVNVRYNELFQVMYKVSADANAKTGVDLATVTFTDGKRDVEVNMLLNVGQ